MAKKKSGPASAQSMAKKQREISISEFFSRNRHLLGFDNPKRALLTAVKEAVDNSLDACEEAHITPEIDVQVRPVPDHPERLTVIVRDNGPGIVKAQIPKIFGKLLYGSKFHRLKMSRGQQGIGISAAAMYGQLTTGKPIKVTSKISPRKKRGSYFEIRIDTKTNNPIIQTDEEVPWEHPKGTRIEIELEGKAGKGRQSVLEYLRFTAVSNPHATITYLGPDGEKLNIERATKELPEEPREIKPHPYGVELGVLTKMMHDTKCRNISSFLNQDFCRVSSRVAKQICEAARLKPTSRPSRIARTEADRLYKAINATKLMNPPTDCISPIGEALLIKGLQQNFDAEFYTSFTRSPSVYRGNPFQVEVALAYGGDIPPDGTVQVMRIANRVPLQYQPGSCAVTQAVSDVDWKSYRLSQGRGGMPEGPVVIMVHFASVWVPFTSESKEAIASYDVILKELKLAIQECGRRLSRHLRGRELAQAQAKRRNIFELYIQELAESVHRLTGEPKQPIQDGLVAIAQRATERADANDRKEVRQDKRANKKVAKKSMVVENGNGNSNGNGNAEAQLDLFAEAEEAG